MIAAVELREHFAQQVREGVEEMYPTVFFPGREITLGANTSDCPTIRADLGNGEVYNITITRARK